MRITEERPARLAAPKHREAPLYDRPSSLKSSAWLLAGIVFVIVGGLWLGEGMQHGVAVNFYGWAMIVFGAVLIVRRGLDLIFPPSRL